MAGYNGNGRPAITIYENSSTFSLHTPEGIRKGLNREDAAAILTSYPVKPDIKFHKENGTRFPGAAKTFFRSAISGMPLPEALQEV